MSRSVAPYPWASLERIRRRTLRDARHARRAVQRAARLDGLADALGELLAAEVRLVLRDVRVAELPVASEHVCLGLADGTLLVLDPDKELAARAVGRLLGRSPSLAAPTTPLGAALTGALAAFVIEAARRSGAKEPLELSTTAPVAGVPAVRVDATALVDARPYAVRSWIVLGPEPAREATPSRHLERAGSLSVQVPLVVAASLADRATLSRLAPGDAWMPQAGWWIDSSGVGRGVLSAPSNERGLGVDLAPNGTIVLRDETVWVAADEEDAMQSPKDEAERTLAEAVLDAPVIVRVELGAVSMAAREWAALQPGDVIETGRRVAEPVVLRVAGREVARGELVEIEGEIGVRVREILTGGGDP